LPLHYTTLLKSLGCVFADDILPFLDESPNHIMKLSHSQDCG
jgi:hypothetical protein